MNALFAARLNHHPWHILPSAAQELRVLAETQITLDNFITPRQPMRVFNGVAFINVCGVLAGAMPGIWEKLGNTDYRTLTAELMSARADRTVRAAVLYVRSPGGNCTGCTEVYDVVSDLATQKPVIAYTDSMMCSAAYYISSAASFIYASKTASVGSIGTIYTLMDASEALKAMGVRVFQIASGDLKGGSTQAGYTPAQIADLERVIADYFEAFSSDVRKKRDISDDAMRGQWFKADKAPPGLVDFIGVPSVAAADALALSGGDGTLMAPNVCDELFGIGGPTASHGGGNPNHGQRGRFTSGGGASKGRGKAAAKRTPEPTEPSEKSKRAKAAYVPANQDVQRYSEEHNEAHFASDIGGQHIPGNFPADVELDGENGKRQGIEIKTLNSTKHDRAYMKGPAKRRKAKWERDNKGTMHTVILDDRKVYNANGLGQHNFSKREMYYRRGFGGFGTKNMHKAASVDEIKKLINTPSKQLPPLAKRR